MVNMKTIVIVGKSFSGLTDYLKANGYDWVVLRDVKTTKFPDKKFKRRVVCDFSSEEGILEGLGKLKVKPDAVMVTYEGYVRAAALIARHFGLPGMPEEAARACTDKYIMRSKFALSPEKISPAFAEVRSREELVEFAEVHGFPLITKPANLAKSLLVAKSANMDELMANYDKFAATAAAVYAKYAPNSTPKMVVEEFMEGSVHSVDAFVDAEGTPHVIDGIVDYQTGYEIGYDDNFHYSRIMPSRIAGEEKTAFMRCAELGCRALGMRSSAAHIEIIMTAEGPRIVEIGARNGGYRERMYELSEGIDVTRNALALAMGEPVDIAVRRNESVAVLELFPREAGAYRGIANVDGLKGLSSLFQLHEKAKEGEFVGKSSDGYKMCAMVFLHNSEAVQFQRDLDYVNRNVFVETEGRWLA